MFSHHICQSQQRTERKIRYCRLNGNFILRSTLSKSKFSKSNLPFFYLLTLPASIINCCLTVIIHFQARRLGHLLYAKCAWKFFPSDLSNAFGIPHPSLLTVLPTWTECLSLLRWFPSSFCPFPTHLQELLRNFHSEDTLCYSHAESLWCLSGCLCTCFRFLKVILFSSLQMIKSSTHARMASFLCCSCPCRLEHISSVSVVFHRARCANFPSVLVSC